MILFITIFQTTYVLKVIVTHYRFLTRRAGKGYAQRSEAGTDAVVHIATSGLDVIINGVVCYSSRMNKTHTLLPKYVYISWRVALHRRQDRRSTQFFFDHNSDRFCDVEK